MNKGLKITLITVGSLALVGGITYAIVRSIRKSRKAKEELEKELANTQQLEQINQGLQSQQTSSSDKIIPIRNLDKSINNSFSQIKGVKLFPAKKSNDPVQGHPFADGFANIRETPEVNNSQGIVDLWQDNLLGTISAGQSIGTIVSEQYDNMSPKMRWFRVKLTKEMDGEKFGWVRGDVVTFFPFTRKKTTTTTTKSAEIENSNFDGSFVVKYNNTYPLGAEVFPHPNWMIGYPSYGKDVTSDFEGNLDLDL